ncbi:MAG: SRPBCC family protein, partial [Candidatus Ranarchaeia archaeon]
MTPDISNDAVLKATSKSWNGWFDILNKKKMQNEPHNIIAIYLVEEHKISPWWAQTVTVEYEKHLGRRVKGQTKEVGFQIGVQKTIPFKKEAVWDLLLSSEGLQVWLGPPLHFTPEEGHTYSTKDGLIGKVRVLKPNDHMRLTYQPEDWEEPSTLQITVTSKKLGRTAVRIHHEKLADAESRQKMNEHWKDVLTNLAILAKSTLSS